jgi:hypothetical protein
MSELVPPLPELEIEGFTRHYVDQDSVDRALSKIYKLRPDFFQKFAERERYNLDVIEIAPDFLSLLAEVREEVPMHHLAPGLVLGEARRRSRLMYGIPLLPPVDGPKSGKLSAAINSSLNKPY